MYFLQVSNSRVTITVIGEGPIYSMVDRPVPQIIEHYASQTRRKKNRFLDSRDTEHFGF